MQRRETTSSAPRQSLIAPWPAGQEGGATRGWPARLLGQVGRGWWLLPLCGFLTATAGPTAVAGRGPSPAPSAEPRPAGRGCSSTTAPADIPPAPSVGGTISGLGTDTLVLQNNGGHDLRVSALTLPADGTFTFPCPCAPGAYHVTVLRPPPGRTCTVTKGAGTVVSAPVTDVRVSCGPAVTAAGGLQGAETVMHPDGVNLYLSNSLIEVGARANGSYGTGFYNVINGKVTCFAPPTGYHPRTDAVDDGHHCHHGLGFRAVNPIDLHWDATTLTYGDFFLPGAPHESFAVGVGEKNYWNNDAYTEMTGSWTSQSYTNGRGAAATWSGTVDTSGVSVTSVSTIPESGFLLHTDVTLTNTTGTDRGPVYYWRGVDPDNCMAQTPTFGPTCANHFWTYNLVEYSHDAARGSRVSARQSDGSYLALLTSVPQSRAIVGADKAFCNGYSDDRVDFSSLAGIWDGTNACVRKATDFEHYDGYPGAYRDLDMGVILKIDHLPAGQSQTFRVTYLLLAPPPAPGRIIATAHGSSRIDVAWTPPAPGHYAPVTGYAVQSATSAIGPWTDAPGTCAAATTSTSTGVTCAATGLSAATTYYFRVAPINASGTGAFLDPAHATTDIGNPAVTVTAD